MQRCQIHTFQFVCFLFFQTQDSDFCLTKHHGSIREISYCIILSSSQCRNPVDSKSTKLNTKHFQPGGLRGFKHSGIQKLLCQHIYGRSTVATSMQCSVTLQECFMFWIIFSLSISSSHLLCFTHTHHIYCVYFFPLFLKEKKYLKSRYLFCSLLKTKTQLISTKRLQNILFIFQKKFIEKFQAGESGIVLKPLNARLSTCILKNEQKKRTKKEEKNKTVWRIQNGCLLWINCEHKKKRNLKGRGPLCPQWSHLSCKRRVLLLMSL